MEGMEGFELVVSHGRGHDGIDSIAMVSLHPRDQIADPGLEVGPWGWWYVPSRLDGDLARGNAFPTTDDHLNRPHLSRVLALRWRSADEHRLQVRQRRHTPPASLFNPSERRLSHDNVVEYLSHGLVLDIVGVRCQNARQRFVGSLQRCRRLRLQAESGAPEESRVGQPLCC